MRKDSAYQRKEAELLIDQLDNMIDNLEGLKSQLKKFEKEHKKEIETNKEYYGKVSKIREELGLPMEVGVYEWKESASIKDRLTGGGYYDELSMEILDLGKRKAHSTGGFVSIAELVLALNKERPGKIVSAADIIKGVEKLVEAEIIQPLVKLKSGVLIAEFVAVNLTTDQQDVLDFAARQGFVTVEKVLISTNWAPERVTRVLNEMESSGMAIKEESLTEGTKYWFPGLESSI
jgi:hypothetical protein